MHWTHRHTQTTDVTPSFDLWMPKMRTEFTDRKANKQAGSQETAPTTTLPVPPPEHMCTHTHTHKIIKFYIKKITPLKTATKETKMIELTILYWISYKVLYIHCGSSYTYIYRALFRMISWFGATSTITSYEGKIQGFTSFWGQNVGYVGLSLEPIVIPKMVALMPLKEWSCYQGEIKQLKSQNLLLCYYIHLQYKSCHKIED